MSNSSNLERKKRRAIAALLVHQTAKDAAKEAGVGYSTLVRWMDEPGFKADLRRAQEKQLEQATSRLAGELPAAIVTLAEIHSDQDAPASARVRAASLVLDYYLRFIDAYELSERIAVIEELIASQYEL